MPRIKKVISTQLARPVRLPRNIGFQTAEDLGAGAFAELTRFGGQLAQIAENLQNTEDDLALTRMRGEFSLQSANLQESIKTEDPAVQGEMFRTGMIELANTIKASSDRTAVQTAFQQFVNLNLPRDLIAVNAESLKQRRDRNIANLNEMTIQTAKAAALSFEEPAVRDILISDLFEVIDRMTDRGELSFVERGVRREALEEQVLLDEMQLLRRTNPVLLKERADAGFYDTVPRIEMLKILEASQRDQDQKLRQTRALRVEARFQENREFFKKLENDTLTLDEVLDSPSLTREDRTFYSKALSLTAPIETDPATAVRVENLLDPPTLDRQEQVRSAEQAKALAETSFVDDKKLSRTDALNMIRRANSIIRGDDPETERWFKFSRKFLRDKFGYDTAAEAFLHPEGAAMYWPIMNQLMREQELNPEVLRGEAIFDRAKELAGPSVVGFFRDTLGRFPTSLEGAPPANPADPRYQNETYRGNKTGQGWTSTFNKNLGRWEWRRAIK